METNPAPATYAERQEAYLAACDAAGDDVVAAAKAAYWQGGMDARTRLGRAVQALIDTERDYPRASRNG